MAAPGRDHRGRDRALPGRLHRLVGVQRAEQPPVGEGDSRQHVTLSNFSDLLHNNDQGRNTGAMQDAPVPALVPELGPDRAAAPRCSRRCSGALAAYAFSRFRFNGRRLGMLMLLLIQMFPQLARGRGDLPDRLQHRRRLPAARARQAGGGDHRLPRRGDGRAGVADQGLLRHDPGRARRVRAGRRRHARPRSSGGSSCRWRRPCWRSSR